MSEYMLDTDVCIYLMSGRYPNLDKRIREAGETICTSSIVFAELAFGAENSGHQARNRSSLDLLVQKLPVLPFDLAAARHYGEFRATLRRAGTPVGANDMLIGAHACSLDLTLVTNNRREFDRMPGLKVENWT